MTAVEALQQKLGIPVTGIVDSATIAAVGDLSEPNVRGLPRRIGVKVELCDAAEAALLAARPVVRMPYPASNVIVVPAMLPPPVAPVVVAAADPVPAEEPHVPLVDPLPDAPLGPKPHRKSQPKKAVPKPKKKVRK